MNILSSYSIATLMMSGLMFIFYRNRKTLQKARVVLTKKIRR